MPQIFQVLRCFKCLVFQVHQTKKSNKFKCKLCGENQSIKRHYGVGIAKDCRLHVQKLNGVRQEIDELNISVISDSDQDDPEEEIVTKTISSKRSKWSEFVEIDDVIPKDNVQSKCNQDMMLGNQEVVLEIPKKKFKRPPPTKLKVSPELNITKGNKTFEKIFTNQTPNLSSSNMIENNINVSKKFKQIEKPIVKPISSNRSKWSEYVEIDDEIPKENMEVECNQAMMLGNQEVVIEVPKKMFQRPPPTKSIASPDLNITMVNNKFEKIFSNDNSNLVGNKINEDDTNATKNKQIEKPIVSKDVNISTLVSLPNSRDIRSLSVNESKRNEIQSSLQSCSNGRSSKWVQFVDSDINETDDSLESSTQINCQYDLGTMFSLSENDVDLNELLDF